MKDITAIRRELVKQGWRLDDSGKHTKAYSPDGITVVTMSKTASDHRAIDNSLRYLRKGGFVWPPKGGK